MASHEPESTGAHKSQDRGRDGQRKKFIYAVAIAIVALFLIIYLV